MLLFFFFYSAVKKQISILLIDNKESVFVAVSSRTVWMENNNSVWGENFATNCTLTVVINKEAGVWE